LGKGKFENTGRVVVPGALLVLAEAIDTFARSEVK
jgi:hypothetical protein